MDMFARKGVRAAIVVVSVIAGTAMAETRYLPPVPVDGSVLRDYRCEGGKSLQVAYYNQHEGQSFAILTVDGKRTVFVDTIAGSGVKYVAGRYIWWTKGERGDLYDAMSGPNAPAALAGCTSQPAA